jgi:hypothetical protein
MSTIIINELNKTNQIFVCYLMTWRILGKEASNEYLEQFKKTGDFKPEQLSEVYVDTERRIDIRKFSERLEAWYKEVLQDDSLEEYPAMDALLHDLILTVVKNIKFEFNLSTVETIAVIEEFIPINARPWVNINSDVRSAPWFSEANTEFNNDTTFDFSTL